MIESVLDWQQHVLLDYTILKLPVTNLCQFVILWVPMTRRPDHSQQLNIPPPVPSPQFRQRPQNVAPRLPPQKGVSLLEKPWFKALSRGLAVCAVVGIIADLLQPLAPFATYGIVGSLIGLLLLWFIRRPMKRSGNPAVPEVIDPAIVTMLVVLLSSAGLKGTQFLLPDGNERGVIGANNDAVRNLQDKLTGIERTIVKVEKGVERVETGVTRLEFGVGVVQQTTKATDDRTKIIDKKVDAIQQASDPAILARQSIEAARKKIERADLSLDNAGYFKALARGDYDELGAFKELGIVGDEAALRKALITYPVSSTEFPRLKGFIDQAHSDHYAAKIPAEFKSLLAEVRRSGSVNRLRQAACEARSTAFIDQFIRTSLAKSCPDENRWLESSLEFAKKLVDIKETETLLFWTMQAKQTLIYKPTSASVRTISGDQLIAASQGRSQIRGEHVQADVIVTLYEYDIGSHVGATMDLFAASANSPTGLLTLNDASKLRQQQQCWIKKTGNHWDLDDQNRQRKPKCLARVTVFAAPTGGLTVVSVDSIRQLAGGASQPTGKR